MKLSHNYYVYILTNPAKTVLYIGVTNDLARRINEHYEERTSKKSFAGRYHCYYLLYYEYFNQIDFAIRREKELKGWTRKKKEDLIKNQNPEMKFLNKDIFG